MLRAPDKGQEWQDTEISKKGKKKETKSKVTIGAESTRNRLKRLAVFSNRTLKSELQN